MDKVLAKSIKNAVEFGHEYVTIEHIALVILEEKEIVDIFEKLELDISLAIKDLENYLNDNEYNNLKHPSGSTGDPKKTVAVERVFQRAFAQSIFNGRENVTAIDVLVSISNENNSHASYFLSINGLDRQRLIDHLSSDTVHGDFSDVDYLKNLNEIY